MEFIHCAQNRISAMLSSMKLPLTRWQLQCTASYLVTVLFAAVLLIFLRWSSATDLGDRLVLVSTSVWQASVWPLYLLLLLVGD